MSTKYNLLYKFIVILSTFGLFLPVFSFAQNQITPPDTLEEAKEMGERVVKVGITELPEIMKKTWEEEAMPIWRAMYDKWSGWWDNTIQPWLQNIWEKIAGIFGREVEKRKPVIEEEFQKEKEELKEEAPEIGKSLWERFKELIK